MKTNHVLFLVVFSIFISCQKEETVVDNSQVSAVDNWTKADPEKTFKNSNDGFSISKNAIKEALSLPEVATIRFVLEVDQEVLQIRVVGVDKNGKTTEGMLAKPASLEKTIDKLAAEKSTLFEKSAFPKAVAAHIMQPADAVTFITGWQEQFSNKTLEDAIAYDGMRIEHFSMPAAVGEQMLLSKSENINLVWGVNLLGKFTTVFLPELDSENSLLKSGELVFEYSTPCPPTCPPTYPDTGNN